MSGVWFHQFTKDGKEQQVGEEKIEGTVNQTRPLFAQGMICVHCGKKFIQGKEPRPQDTCPARNDKRELKRIKNVTG